MDSDVIALLGGLLFLLLALVGGGFTIKEISMPTIPSLARAACLVVGVTLVVLSFLPSLRDGVAPADDDEPAAGADEPASGGDGATTSPTPSSGSWIELHSFSEGTPAEEDGVLVSDLRVTGRTNPVHVNDMIQVEYTLINDGSEPLTFVNFFTGVRSPADENEDANEDQGTEVPPGGSRPVTHTVVLDEQGPWMIWPCYEVQQPGGGSNECPPEWNRFFVDVEP